jgi:hypothetical protein
MGLARIAIAVLAVVLAFGLLIIGGIALWGALTGKDDGKEPGATTSMPSGAPTTKPSKQAKRASSSGAQVDNTITVHCLAAQCQVFVAGPEANDVQFNGGLTQNETRIFNGSRLTVAVQDASTVDVTINGRQQAKGRRGMPATYEVPAQQ